MLAATHSLRALLQLSRCSCVQPEVTYDVPLLVPVTPAEPWRPQHPAFLRPPPSIPYVDMDRAEAVRAAQGLRERGVRLPQWLSIHPHVA